MKPMSSCTAIRHTAVKAGPKDARNAKERAEMADTELFDDAAKTIQGILASDSVAIVSLEDFQLFVKRTGLDGTAKDRKVDKEKVILGFTQGKPWPSNVEPIVAHVPTAPGMRVMGRSGSGQYHFDQTDSAKQFSQVIHKYIKSRHFWWDREEGDTTSNNLMAMMPEEAKTTLMATLMTPDGALRFAILSSWNRPPASFTDYSRMALPFQWILGGSVMAAMSVRKVRTMEQSQISYSNLQAHELRTPLHQILAITQLLRSQMNDLADTPSQQQQNSLTTMQQIRDLLPYLDAIDTSGRTLHGIVDNILSFLDLKGKDNMLMPSQPGLMNSPSGAQSSLEVMFEELIEEACEEDKRTRIAKGQPPSNVETIFEIIPPLLGEQVTEDAGGALRKAISKILSNAYKFIESQGCVEIYVDDVVYRRPPEGCEDLSLTKMISIIIVDSGKGMDDDFVRDKLGEPWAKEDPFATGSGLSVHLAWRIIDLMGGEMEISSTANGGTTVKIEVPVPKRKVSVPNSPVTTTPDKLHGDDPSHLATHPDHFQVDRKVALLGYDKIDKDTCVWGLPRLGKVLHHSFVKMGCHLVSVEDAEVVVLDGRMEEAAPDKGEHSLYHWLDKIGGKDIVILVAEDHEAHPDVLARERECRKQIRRYRKPITPTILREILFPDHSRQVTAKIPTTEGGSYEQPINSPDKIDAHGNEMKSSGSTKSGLRFDESTIEVKRPCRLSSAITGISQLWKPKGMAVEEAVASLCLGDYFSSRRKGSLSRTTSNTSSHERDKSIDSTPTLVSGEFSDINSTPAMSMNTPSDDHGEMEYESEPETEPENIKVMVVEDNMINRKILVKILSTKLNIEVIEAADGSIAVEKFRTLNSPAISTSPLPSLLS
jgi:signal transduction histidine kinase